MRPQLLVVPLALQCNEPLLHIVLVVRPVAPALQELWDGGGGLVTLVAMVGLGVLQTRFYLRDRC